jgi:hypothetical protein
VVPRTTFSSKNAVLQQQQQDTVLLGCTVKKVLLILYKAPPQRENSMTLKEIISQAEGTSIGNRIAIYDKSIMKLRKLRLVEALRFPGHRDFYFRLTKDGILEAHRLRRFFETQVQDIMRLL